MDVIGGGLLVAVAALLWIAYLLPSWLRRRQYLATERNAVRLQQTLRILAETAETPEAVRVEATAREVAVQQRILHEHEETARLEAEAAEHLAIAERRAAEEAAHAARARAAEALAAHEPVTEPIPTIAPAAHTVTATDAEGFRRSKLRALRRKRALTSLVLLVSLITVIAGLIAAVFGASLLVPAGGAIGVIAAVGMLARLAKVRVPPAAVEAQAARESAPFEPIELAEESTAEPGWIPQPLPRPLHLSRGTIAAMAMASIEAAAELKRVETGEEVARRASALDADVPSIAPAARVPAEREAAPRRPVARTAEPASPYARMGIVDDARPAFGDLDAVLRRRREVG
ncbi:hypothetical protein [Agromyces ramosus]|uniref:Large exoprotein n=1 Tax=Agromyces ramosus TaxID=33879 RepID=A0ABU0R4L8_9MICO|nr:hypothetical protein [Agromyces ramosus]MDQ0893016.1 hypothetical protein [Agromyces ramosus]